MSKRIPNLKNKIINCIKLSGFGLTEIIIDIEIDGVVFNSIEWDSKQNKIFLHVFVSEYDYSWDYDDLEYSNKLKIWEILSIMWN